VTFANGVLTLAMMTHSPRRHRSTIANVEQLAALASCK
jgi:hypothetical protein